MHPNQENPYKGPKEEAPLPPLNDSSKPSDLPPLKEMGSLYDYAKQNSRDMLAYLLLVLGIILIFFEEALGGGIVGLLFGIYFTSEITWVIRNIEQLIEDKGLGKSIVLGGFILALFISTPALLIGVALSGAIGLFVHRQNH